MKRIAVRTERRPKIARCCDSAVSVYLTASFRPSAADIAVRDRPPMKESYEAAAGPFFVLTSVSLM